MILLFYNKISFKFLEGIKFSEQKKKHEIYKHNKFFGFKITIFLVIYRYKFIGINLKTVYVEVKSNQ